MKKREIVDVLKQLNAMPLPDKEKILSVCPQPTDPREAATTATYRRKLGIKALVAICAAVILLISGVSTYAIAAEKKQYNEALIFFHDYDLSLDGLSRDEIKKVYRDIKIGTFTYGKTAEVIERSITESTVDGHEIFQDEPAPEDLKNLWNYKNNNGYYQIQNSVRNQDNAVYKYYSEEKYNDEFGFDVHDKSVVEKYVDNKLVWSTEFNNFWIENYVAFDNKVIVYGLTPNYSSIHKDSAWMALIDHDGTVLWETKLDNGFQSEYIVAILPGDDDKMVVFSRGDLNYLCLNEFDIKGKALGSHKTVIGNYGVWNAAKLDDGYILQLGSYVSGEYARIVKVSKDGSLMDSFSYESDDSYYYITDMIEYNGFLYLSAYSVPLLVNEENSAGGRYDIAAILNYIFDNQLFNISNEELTKLVRDHFTAVLLVCDPVSGTPREFYSVKGSLGGKLALSDSDKLLWDVESISDTYFSPATSAFTIGGASYVYRYIFDENGTILNQEKTGEVTGFYR